MPWEQRNAWSAGVEVVVLSEVEDDGGVVASGSNLEAGNLREVLATQRGEVGSCCEICSGDRKCCCAPVGVV